MRVQHLVKRTIRSVSQKLPSQEEIELVQQVLRASEFALWSAMQPRDKRHSIEVLHRFDCLAPAATTSERASALLHDVGKNISQLGLVMRVVATIVGPRGKRFSLYHQHEELGAELLAVASEARTVELVAGLVQDPIAKALRDADDI
jgi:hypothetical protein